MQVRQSALEALTAQVAMAERGRAVAEAALLELTTQMQDKEKRLNEMWEARLMAKQRELQTLWTKVQALEAHGPKVGAMRRRGRVDTAGFGAGGRSDRKQEAARAVVSGKPRGACCPCVFGSYRCRAVSLPVPHKGRAAASRCACYVAARRSSAVTAASRPAGPAAWGRLTAALAAPLSSRLSRPLPHGPCVAGGRHQR